MMVVLPFYQGDAKLALDLLRWIRQLGGATGYDLLLVADAAIQWSIGMEVIKEANDTFKHAQLITTDKPIVGWPQGANALWKRAAIWCKEQNTNFLWLEPDAVPVTPDWLDQLARAYTECHKPFMGRFYACDNPALPSKLMSGIAIYPENAIDLLDKCADGELAWDVTAAGTVVPLAHNTRLIHHFWGMVNLPPIFAERRTQHSPINTFTLENIGEQTVLFHRNKDGSLIRLLRRRLAVPNPTEPFLIVIPACNRDAELAIKNVRWMQTLGGCSDHECLLAFPTDIVGRYSAPLEDAAKACFKHVSKFRYQCSSIMSWPEGANIAFRSTAKHVQGGKTAWFWMEPDAVALCAGWENMLQCEYERCGLPFMGPIVPGMGHMNGCGIYPPNTCDLIPNSLSEWLPRHLAWDSVMRDEMIDLCHDASKLIQHVWGIVDGKPHPMLGEAPSFTTQQQVDEWILPGAAVFHRCKDGSIIDRLTERKS